MIMDRTNLDRNVLPLKRDGRTAIVIAPSKCAAMLKVETLSARLRHEPDTPSNPEGKDIMMGRRTFSALLTGAAASLISTRGMAATSTLVKASNVVLVHGLFADGSCWSEVIARLQAAGLNATAVQNPLTTLPEAVASA